MVVRSVALLVLTVPPGVALADEQTGVGVVAEYRPTSQHFSFVRPPRDEVVPVRIPTVVMAGDRISLKAGESVTIQLASGRTTELKGPMTYTIADSGPLGKLGDVFARAWGVFDDEFREEGLAGSRGGEPCTAEGQPVQPVDVPILVPGARIVAGDRDLPLAWRGGCAPFVVTVLAGGQSLVHRESIDGRQVRLDDVPLGPGRYLIVVADAGGRRFEASLEAAGSGPALPTEIAADTSSLGVIAQAIWLAQHEEGRWRLESFERLRPLIRAGDPLAGAIGDGVLWGSAER